MQRVFARSEPTTMDGEGMYIHDLEDLRKYVRQTICQQNELEETAFEITERILVRSGIPCGIFFCLHGPRSVRLTAIWETDRNTILFYGSAGQRLQTTRLMTAPQLRLVAA
jgi:hypothetical protein